MTAEEWNTFLCKTATKIHKLIGEPANLEAFREAIRPFGETYGQQQRAEDQWQAKHTPAEFEALRKKDWLKAKRDPRLRNRDVRPDNWEWDNTCGLEFVERDGVRYVKMPACLADKYLDHLREFAVDKREWARCAREELWKAALERAREKPTADLLLTHNWWQCWPATVDRQYKAGAKSEDAKQRVDRIEQAIGEKVGCCRPKGEPRPTGDIVDRWFPADARSPGKLPRLNPEAGRQRQYVTLTAVHDNELPDNKIGTEDIWPPELMVYLWSRVNVCHPEAFAPRKAFVQAALDDVGREFSREIRRAEHQPSEPQAESAPPSNPRVGAQAAPQAGPGTSTAASDPGANSTPKKWKPPKNYTGAKSAGVPRSTLEGWEQQDDKDGGILHGKVKRDPQTKEKYYPTTWLNKRKKGYKPRRKSP